MNNYNEITGECTCGEVDCWYCDDVDPFSTFNLSISDRRKVDEGGPSMPDVTYEQMLQAEEQQIADQQECHSLYQRHQAIMTETKRKMKWIAHTKKKLEEAEQWVNEKDSEMLQILTQHDRLQDTIRVRSDYIILEKQKYPLQFPEA